MRFSLSVVALVVCAVKYVSLLLFRGSCRVYKTMYRERASSFLTLTVQQTHEVIVITL